jgi:hypothetical protein
MKTVKKVPEANVEQLNELIEATAILEYQQKQQQKKIDDNRDIIKHLLARIGQTERATPAGYAATIINSAKREWDVAKLRKVLDDKRFESLCPRKAESAKLLALMESDVVIAPKLEKCVTVTNQERLSITSPPMAS